MQEKIVTAEFNEGGLPKTVPLEKPRLDVGDAKNPTKAYMYRLSQSEFERKLIATKAEKGVLPEDAATARNLKKMLVASLKLGQIAVLRWNDTYEEVVGTLSLNVDHTVILRELIPDNLLEVSDAVLKVDMKEVSDKEVAEATQLINMLPQADDSTFIVNDYRTLGLETHARKSLKVMELESILGGAERVVAVVEASA